MNKWVGLSSVLLMLINSVFGQHHQDKPSTHGMLLMGSNAIYASHLPMFHTPHDYQIILKLRFDEEGNRRYLDDRKAHPEELVYTIEPEVFVLPEMVNHTKKFKGKVYRGHFERGGVAIADEVSVSIEQVIYFKHFKANEKKPVRLKYILFGNEKEQFLAHQISASPDFDEILSVNMKNEKINFTNSAYKILEFNENDKRAGFSWKTNSAELEQKKIEFNDHKTLYLELGDLD